MLKLWKVLLSSVTGESKGTDEDQSPCGSSELWLPALLLADKGESANGEISREA